MNVHILTVPNDEIKVRKGFTGADWWFDDRGDLQVRVATELEDWREAMALAIHEAAEALMCKHLGITGAQVDEYDSKFEQEHPGDGTTNVGDIHDCPYRIPHNAATAMERTLTTVLDVPWQDYDDRLSAL
jgi:hypothetical protein